MSIFPQVVENPLDFDAHNKHVDAWINENVDFLIQPSNKLYIYVTGLTPVLTAFLHYYDIHMPESAMVSLMHYNRDTKNYVEQRWI